MCPIKLCTKPIFRIFHIFKVNIIMPLCNLFIERPSYTHDNGQEHHQIKEPKIFPVDAFLKFKVPELHQGLWWELTALF